MAKSPKIDPAVEFERYNVPKAILHLVELEHIVVYPTKGGPARRGGTEISIRVPDFPMDKGIPWNADIRVYKQLDQTPKDHKSAVRAVLKGLEAMFAIGKYVRSEEFKDLLGLDADL